MDNKDEGPLSNNAGGPGQANYCQWSTSRGDISFVFRLLPCLEVHTCTNVSFAKLDIKNLRASRPAKAGHGSGCDEWALEAGLSGRGRLANATVVWICLPSHSLSIETSIYGMQESKTLTKN